MRMLANRIQLALLKKKKKGKKKAKKKQNGKNKNVALSKSPSKNVALKESQGAPRGRKHKFEQIQNGKKLKKIVQI